MYKSQQIETIKKHIRLSEHHWRKSNKYDESINIDFQFPTFQQINDQLQEDPNDLSQLFVKNIENNHGANMWKFSLGNDLESTFNDSQIPLLSYKIDQELHQVSKVILYYTSRYLKGLKLLNKHGRKLLETGETESISINTNQEICLDQDERLVGVKGKYLQEDDFQIVEIQLMILNVNLKDAYNFLESQINEFQGSNPQAGEPVKIMNNQASMEDQLRIQESLAQLNNVSNDLDAMCGDFIDHSDGFIMTKTQCQSFASSLASVFSFGSAAGKYVHNVEFKGLNQDGIDFSKNNFQLGINNPLNIAKLLVEKGFKIKHDGIQNKEDYLSQQFIISFENDALNTSQVNSPQMQNNLHVVQPNQEQNNSTPDNFEQKQQQTE